MDNIEALPAKKVTIWNKNFICVMFCSACLSLSHSSVNTLVSSYSSFLGASSVIVGALTGMFFGVAFAMRPISGPIATKLDKRALIIFANALGAIVYSGYALFGNIPAFLFFRILNGVQYSFIGSLSLTIASDSLPKEKMGSGIGVYSIGGATAMAFGPTIGIALKELGTALSGDSFGYKMVFIFSATTMALSIIPSILLKTKKRSKEELAGTGIWYKNIFAVNALPPAFILSLCSMGYALLQTYMYPYANSLGIAGIGAFFMIMAFSFVVIRPVSGKLTDKFGVFKILMPGMAIFALALVCVGLSRSLPAMLVCAFLSAIGYGTLYPATQAMCMQSVAPVRRAVASNTIFAGNDLGLFFGPFLGGIVYTISGNYSSMYIFMAMTSILAMGLLAVTWKGYSRRRSLIENLE